MKIGILTFHAAHNYGSMLQNYALQQVLIKLGHQPETINLRTELQKEIYDFFLPFCKMKDKKHIARRIIFRPWKKSLLKKFQLFEQFLSNELSLSNEIAEYGQLNTLLSYDGYIIGSDQCWNVAADDFDWSYFLDFTPDSSRRISYAISAGPHPKEAYAEKADYVPRIKENLNRFDAISVRDNDTKAEIDAIVEGAKEVNVHVDPTLLLTADEWSKLAGDEPLIKKPYVFFYNPYWIGNVFEQAVELGKITNLPVVNSVPNMVALVKRMKFEKYFESGPKEFLNLVKNADYVVGRSFHLMVFCAIFHKKFIAIDGMGDSRISELLRKTGLEACASDNGNLTDVLARIGGIDYETADCKIAEERQRSIAWLNEHLCE